MWDFDIRMIFSIYDGRCRSLMLICAVAGLVCLKKDIFIVKFPSHMLSPREMSGFVFSTTTLAALLNSELILRPPQLP